MGLSESKRPFEEDGSSRISQTEIGIAQMIDPRSPGYDFERTPVVLERRNSHGEDAGVLITDPRSPSNAIQRTPIVADKFGETTTDHEVDAEQLRVRIQRLKLFDTPISNSMGSEESLSNNKEVIDPKKTTLKLLDDESNSVSKLNFDAVYLPISPPRPRSRSTPKAQASLDTPVSSERLLKKKRRSNIRKQNKGSQPAERLQKTVVKKAFTEQTPRSPLAERNRDVNNDWKTGNKKSSKTAGVVKYSKYKSLNESLTGEIFPGKENEEFVW